MDTAFWWGGVCVGGCVRCLAVKTLLVNDLADYGSFLSERPLSGIAPRGFFSTRTSLTTCTVGGCGFIAMSSGCNVGLFKGSGSASGRTDKADGSF